MGYGSEAQKKNKLNPIPVAPQPVANKGPVKIRLTTDSGVMIIRLYDSTPLHRDNFVKLVKEHYFDSLMFHRVIKDFMIQGGDPDSKNAPPGIELGNGGPGYTIPAEFDTSLFHKKGVIAAAREGDAVNPLKASSGSQFYIVQGRKYSDAEMNAIENAKNIRISEDHRLVYRTVGGTPFLDMNYTVFGEVESGIEVVDKISAAAKDINNRPLHDIRMKIEIIENPIKTGQESKVKKQKHARR
jgi:Peptidyl-prolyl cis-trans isomerase (rotamase) - cyclophilin family